MKGFSFPLIATTVALLGCATGHGTSYIYFGDLAQRVLSGDAAAFREVLAKAGETPPGEQLEELAEISSKYVTIDPADFLRAQSAYQYCFGVDFFGPDYTDNFQAALQEDARRYKALESIADPALATVKDRCIAELEFGDGS